ncbi:MAG: hypothetical protein IPQ07_01765 [Myxococcales bacterium]|nr:hypothetical protein [Myxococcales bacterium]
MDHSAELRLPTVAVPVRLALVGHEVVDAEVFVVDVGHGDLVDQVGGVVGVVAAFIPVRTQTKVRLLATHAIAWLSIAAVEPTPGEVVTLHDHQYRVELELAGGTVLTGTLLDSAPADRPRAIDHLNRAGAFVRLWTPERHYLINKAQIVGVTES